MSGIIPQDHSIAFELFGPCTSEIYLVIAIFLIVELLILLFVYLAIKYRRWFCSIRVNHRLFHNGESPYEGNPLSEMIF